MAEVNNPLIVYGPYIVDNTFKKDPIEEKSVKPAMGFSKRPEAVQKRIDQVFDTLVKKGVDTNFRFTGDSGCYHLLGFDECEVIDQRIKKAPANKKDLYFIDFGAGHFTWVDEVCRFLNKKYRGEDRRFHVIGVTGEGKPVNQKEQHKNVFTYKITGFKLENLLEAFSQFGFKLNDSVEFGVFSYTLSHLVDPLGTLEQAYQLLAPENGLIFGTYVLEQLFGLDAERTIELPSIVMKVSLFKDLQFLKLYLDSTFKYRVSDTTNGLV